VPSVDDTPIKYNSCLTPNGGKLLPNATCYRKLIRGFVYLIITRSNIYYVVHIISQFMVVHDPFTMPKFLESFKI